MKVNHDYYHLISGVDLPLKNNFDMVSFFEKNNGKEFIGITPNWADSKLISQRYKLHWFLQNKIGKRKNLLYIISRIITKVEKKMGIRRKEEKNITFYGGPTWFSITEAAAVYILNHRDWVKERFKNTICCDEIYAQTIIGNSHFKTNIYNIATNDSNAECMRYTRFNKESPFVLEMKDFDELLKNECLFARKFGTESPKQKELVDKIFELYR